MQRNTLLTLALVGAVLVAGCAGGSPSTGQSAGQSTDTPEDTRHIEVVGSGSAESDPNRAVLRVGVVASADTASTARQRLAANVSRMRAALADVGVDDEQITTLRYDIYRDRRRPEQPDGEPRVQYRAQHVFEVTLSEIDRVGTVIDTAVDNGATEVEDIEFTLSSSRRRQLEASARRAAMADAREKARSLAGPANLTITGVEVVRTTRAGSPRSSDYAATATPMATATEGAASDVESGPVTVVTTVHVVYNAAQDSGETAAPESS